MGGPRPLVLAIIAAAIRGSTPNVAGMDCCCCEEGMDISGDTLLFEYDDLGGLPLPLLTAPPCPEAEAS